MQPLHHALPAVVADLLRTAPLSPGKVSFAWRAAVGPAFERVTSVRLEGRTLVVTPASPQWARELARSRAIILERVRQLLGPDVVEEIVINEDRYQ